MKIRFLLLLLSLPALGVYANIIDRVAITIDQQVITESQIDEEVRVTAFLNKQSPKWTLEERRAAADRLIQQLLVEREMNLGHYPPPTEQEVQKYFEGVAAATGRASRFSSALKGAQLDADILRAHLGLQLTTVRFIEYRFRPNFEISDEEIEAYRKADPKVQARAAIREILIQQRTDEILSSWLEETRKQANIVYLDPNLS